jgi:RNA polymerase sigma factor (sigma-70 family)
MPEIRSRRLLSPPFSISIPIEGDHPSGEGDHPSGPGAKRGRLQTGMGGRLPSESVVALRPETVVAFDRNTQEPMLTEVAGPPRDQEDLVEVLRRSRSVLKALFRRYAVDPADAEDILQEAALVVLIRWESIEEPDAFLFGVVKRQISRLARKRRVENSVQFDDMVVQELAVDCPQVAVDAEQDARKLLARLPERCRRIVEMRYCDELSSQEIASMLQCPAGSVRVAASRGLRRLRVWSESASRQG